MSEHAHSHVSKYMKVFGALMVLTVVTVGISYFHFGVAVAVALAMIVALTKGSLVAAYFMHLIGERKVIFVVLAITAFFFIVMMAIPTLVLVSDYQMNP